MNTEEVYHIGAGDVTAITLVAMALKATVDEDEAETVGRAVDRVLRHLAQGRIAYAFDGVELRVFSASRPHEGIWHVCDGHTCTCESGPRPWCWHRALYRIILALHALRNPMLLRYSIVQQCGPLVLDAA